LEIVILILGLVVGAYMAWNIGANDVANGMASPVGAKAITLRQAVLIGGLLDFIGATFIGSHVADTIRKGIVEPSAVQDPYTMSLGLLAALMAASIWVFLSSWKQIPVSTTHSIVGSMVGFGIVVGGVSAIKWWTLVGIALSWIVSPVFACGLGYLVFEVIRRNLLSGTHLFRKALRLGPVFVGLTFFIILASLLLDTPLGTRLNLGTTYSLMMALALSLCLGAVSNIWLRRTLRRRSEQGVEEIFKRLQILTACYVSVAHGANDVANAVGPIAGIYIIFATGAISPQAPVPMFLLAFGGLLIALGCFLWGHRVIETLGHQITELTNTRGFSVDFGVATSVLLASKLGLPVSTTHAAVGAVVGVGLARGMAAVDFRLVGKICLYWVVTLPVSALSCMIFFVALRVIFL
jgi:PiT family inorganic phosphate transporter